MFEVRTASCRVGDDGVEPVEVEMIEEFSRVVLREFILAVVGVERSAAALGGRRDDSAAVGEQGIGGVAGDVAVNQGPPAAGGEADAIGCILIASFRLRAPREKGAP